MEDSSISPPRKGSCLCGGVSFEIQTPFKILQCYCLDCQKGAGGPCQIVLGCNSNEVTVNDAENLVKIFIIQKTQSGFVKEKHFCGRCGCTLWTVPMHHGGTKWMVRSALISGGLDFYKPDKEIFTEGRPAYIGKSDI